MTGADRIITTDGIDALVLDDLTHADLPHLTWSGSPSHIRSVAKLLDRVPTGEIDYLTIRAPDGTPICKGCIDYTQHADAGTMEQLATHEAVQGRGLATRLIGVCEERIRHRGLRWAVLGVEDDNPRARALYERLGYLAYGREAVGWDVEDEDGTVSRYETEITLLRKAL